MLSFKAHIERSNRKALDQVDVRVTLIDLSSGRQSWRGDFMSRTADGFLPSERIRLTLDNGQQGTANISETHFDSREPEATLIQFTGKGPLS
jgi:translation initiation factor IF-1